MRSPLKLRSFQPYGTCFFSRIVSHIMTLASYSGKKKSGLYKVGTILTFSPPPTSHFSFLLQLDFLHLSPSVPFFPLPFSFSSSLSPSPLLPFPLSFDFFPLRYLSLPPFFSLILFFLLPFLPFPFFFPSLPLGQLEQNRKKGCTYLSYLSSFEFLYFSG